MTRAKKPSARAKTAQMAKGVTHLQSLNVIRNMIRVSVSEICYLRNLFPEELFKERVYADMRIKCLAPTKEMESKDAKDALLITQWLEDGVFEALEKKYLESVVLCVYGIAGDCKPAELLESYTYNVKHGPTGLAELSTSFTGASPLNCSPQNVKAQAIQLIRSLVSITNNLDPLPGNRLITMKVFFNDNCPEGWQPEHFQKAPAGYREHDQSSSLKIAVGRVVTPHHLVTMEIETAEECLETLSQANSACVEVQAPVPIGEESDGTKTDDEHPTQSSSGDEDHEVEGFANDVATESNTIAVISQPDNDERTGRATFVSFIVLSDRIEQQSIEKRLARWPSTQVAAWLKEFEDGGVLRKASQGVFEVAVHDTNVFFGAINETHSKLKRQIKIEDLALVMDFSTAFAEAMLVRMEHEKLVARRKESDVFDILFSESNRALVRKAIQAAKEKKKSEKDASRSNAVEVLIEVEVPKEVDDAPSPDVYDFEPDTFITPKAGSKRKPPVLKPSITSSVSSHSSQRDQSSTTAISGGCANRPIVQVKRALKKRKLAVKPIS